MGKNQKQLTWHRVCDMREQFLLALENALGETLSSLDSLPSDLKRRDLKTEIKAKGTEWLFKGPDLSDQNDRMLWHIAKALYADARLRELLIEKTN